MTESLFHNRRAFQLENDILRVTVLAEGGHIAEVLHKGAGVNPLWIPPWPSLEPSMWDPSIHESYGNDVESRLLAGIMGHNLCLDLFGGPSEEEAAAGITVHGEAPVALYDFSGDAASMTQSAVFTHSRLSFERRLELEGSVVRVTETVENLAALDRPIAWTQHVTLGPPFVERGRTQFRSPATRSMVIEYDFTGGRGAQKTGAEFDWPLCPRRDGGVIDLRVYPDAPVSAGYTAHLMDPRREEAYFLVWREGLLFGYVWRRADFPWLGRWEENHCRTHAPWNGGALTCGMEFGVSPMPETRKRMIERGSLFGVPGFRWIPARTRVTVHYRIVVELAEAIPDGP
ncbi:MAG: hypothetical protein ACRD44_12395 [Bryobacteraceae bacterium]